jgi:multiple sugar transport system permease protein
MKNKVSPLSDISSYNNINRNRMLRKRISPYLWLIPVLVLMFVILGYPWLFGMYNSLFHWNPIRHPVASFVGIMNYITVITDINFWTSLKITIIFLAVTVGGQMAIGVAFALLLDNPEIKGRKFFLMLLIIPMMLTPSVIGLMFKLLLHNSWGIIPYLFAKFHLPVIGWLSDPAFGLITVILIEIWREYSFVLLITFAALEAIPNEQIEAAAVDGATGFQIIRWIKIPWVRQVLITTLLFRFISAFRAFAVIYSLYKAGGPGNSAKVIGVYLYEFFRKTWELGTASAVALILVLITLLMLIYPIKMSWKESQK